MAKRHHRSPGRPVAGPRPATLGPCTVARSSWTPSRRTSQGRGCHAKRPDPTIPDGIDEILHSGQCRRYALSRSVLALVPRDCTDRARASLIRCSAEAASPRRSSHVPVPASKPAGPATSQLLCERATLHRVLAGIVSARDSQAHHSADTIPVPYGQHPVPLRGSGREGKSFTNQLVG